MSEYYRLHCLTRHKHGLPPQPFRFFRNIQAHLLAKGMGFVALAYLPRPGRGESPVGSRGAAPVPSSQLPAPENASPAIAGAVFLHWNGRALYKFGASDERFLEFRANNLLMWKSFLHCKRLGCASASMGRTERAHEGLRRFKLGWGTRESEVPYFKLGMRKDAWLTDSSRADGWHNNIFRALPGFVARLAGEALYPHLD